MNSFRDRPIKQKLMVLILVITTAALLLSGFSLVVIDAILFHSYLTRDLSTFSRVIADNTTASLAFDDPVSAGEILSALRTRTHVISACLFRQDGAVFAKYTRDGADGACATVSRQNEAGSSWQAIRVTQAVLLKGQRIGNLTIAYDLGELTDRIRIWGATVLIVLALSSLAVLLLSSRLRMMVVTPILELAAVSAAVSNTRNYAVRATQTSRDEIGQLAGAFNEMLASIESRDADLRTTLGEREQALERLAEVNRELKRSNEELERSNQDLERFAFIASHDMQEPLRMVTIYSQLLVRQCGSVTESLVTYRDYIVAGTTRMRELIADLLSYVEITTAPSQTRPVDLNQAISKARENLRMLIEETGTVLITENLPVVHGHEGHMISLFQNLISNAIKYRSEEPPTIRISTQYADGMYCFEVADNGIGIAPEYHAQIFLAFKRLHGKAVQGTGIGLAICQRVVERYGGRIWVESDVGKGAAFRFMLPASASDQFNSYGQRAARLPGLSQ
jgi:signal transduction histidine kinase